MKNFSGRRGAVLPLFAILLPVLIMLCAFAINVAYMQLTTTELKIAADAAARAGGRAWSEEQDLDFARQTAAEVAAMNIVAGEPLFLSTSENDGEIEFGVSSRVNNGYGRYAFTKVTTAEIESGAVPASSIRVNAKKLDSGSGSVSLLFGGVGSRKTFEPVISSICTQVDRDIALTLDRSGSMVYCADEEELYDAVTDLYYAGDINYDEWRASLRNYEGNHSSVSGSLYSRQFPPYVLNGLQAGGYTNLYNYGLGINQYNGRDSGWRAGEDWVWVHSHSSGGYWDYRMTYTSSMSGGGDAPSYSRWDMLLQAVDAFLDVLDVTNQDEQVALGTFSSSGRLDLALDMNFDNVRSTIAGIRPYGGTSIGEGMQESMPSLLANDARPFAAKTIVVLTDGVNNGGEISPVSVATDIVAANNVTIHTVTFTTGADQTTMQAVASVGGGKQYHANDGSGLIEIFREIANNLPTIITD